LKARVYVTLKTTVLDPQGQTIQQAARRLGFGAVAGVRQGKVFDLEINGATPEEARKQVERLAAEVLTNPVIEEYHCVFEE